MMAPPERKAPRLSVSGALNMYLALLPREEGLLDVADPTERARRLHDLLHAHKPLTCELSTKHLGRQQQRVADALDRDLAEGLRTFLAVHRELQPILKALAELHLARWLRKHSPHSPKALLQRIERIRCEVQKIRTPTKHKP